MKDDGFFFSKNIYIDTLRTINRVRFTPREVDIIACISNLRGSSKIASLLGILPSTVVTHTHHIMLKLGRQSRESVVDFVENSGKLAIFKRYYIILVTSAAFEKALDQIAKFKKEETPLRFIVYMPSYTQEAGFISELENHLKRASVKVSICKQKEEKVQKQDVKSFPHSFLLLSFAEESLNQEIFQKFCTDFKILDLRKLENYYFLVLTILTKLLPTVNLENIISEFKSTYEEMRKNFDLLPSKGIITDDPEQNRGREFSMPSTSQRNSHTQHGQCFKGKYCVIALFLVFCTGGGFLLIYETKCPRVRKETLIRSVLSLSKEPLLLNRPELIAQLNDKFKGADDIKVIAIIGVGGAGKTTLAHQYAQVQKAAVVWQFNAETPESLKLSFENLATTLAQTENERKYVKAVLKIEDLKEKEEQALEFVKDSLRSRGEWLLIYDNVNQYADIKKHFPQDVKEWGKGKVILTTRNQHLRNNPQITHTILIGELDPSQRLTLFTKIMSHGNEKIFTPAQAKPFLENIPSYPLDISLAAHYIKATEIGYEDYLNQLEKNNSYFIEVQEKILKESGDYTKTRQSIIALSLDKLIRAQPDFKDLLIFISLLDFQNIPQEILRKFKESEIIDSFIYHLKKHSLVGNESLFEIQSIPMFSLHRSTQAIMRAYFMNDLRSDPTLLTPIGLALGKYVADLIDKQDLLKMQLILGHTETFLNHSPWLPNNVKHALQIELGGLYFHIGFYHKAQQILEESIAALENKTPRNEAAIARGLGYLGSVHRWLGNYGKSSQLLEQSLAIYQKQDPQDHDRIAWVFVLLGQVSRELAHYDKARDFFERGLAIYKEHFSTNRIRIAWTLAHLGSILKSLGEYQQAKDLLHESLTIYEKELSKNQARYAWAAAHLGKVYLQLGDYPKAKELLEESLQTTKAHLPETHVDIAWGLAHLGNAYRKMGQYEKAKAFLQESLTIYEKYLSENPVRYAWAAAHLANIYRKLGHYKQAEDLLQSSLKTFENRLSKNHDRTAWAIALLGIIASEQGDHKTAKELLEKSLRSYQVTLPHHPIPLTWVSSHLGIVYGRLGQHEEAIHLLEKSLQAYQNHYGKNHIKYAQLLRELGRAHFEVGHLNLAQDLMEQALDILNTSLQPHPDVYKVHEDLSELLYQKADVFHKRGDTQQSEITKAQALQSLTKAHEIITIHFPKDSPHVQRINFKLNAVKNKEEGQI